MGDRATAEWDLPSSMLTLSSVDSQSQVPLEKNAFDVSQTYIAAISELMAAIRAGQSTSQPLSEGIASLEIILRAKEQSSF